MDALPLHFRTLRYCGLWWEREHDRRPRHHRRVLVFVVIFGFTLSQIAALVAHRRNRDSRYVAECLYSCATYFTLCLKLVNFAARRDDMLALLGRLREQICAPRSAAEVEVLRRHSRLSSLVFKMFVGGAEAVGALFYVVPLFSSDRAKLPLKTYEFLDNDEGLYYWATYAFQVLAVVLGIAVNACLDTTFCGFVSLVCGQVDLACHRFALSASDDDDEATIKEFVEHHVLVRDVVRRLEGFFVPVILPFFFFCLIALGTTVFMLSQNGIVNGESIVFVLYVATVNVQVLLYCWFGNELIFKGEKIADTVYNADWPGKSTPSDRKFLAYVMAAGQRPLRVSFHGFCTVSLDIYIWVLKTSYAAYSVLKTMASNDN